MQTLSLALQQRFLNQKLRRRPEPDMVMYDQEQDEQYTRDGESGSLSILYDLIINTVRKHSPLRGEALDICCGSGQLLCKLAKSMPDVHFTGIDLSLIHI